MIGEMETCATVAELVDRLDAAEHRLEPRQRAEAQIDRRERRTEDRRGQQERRQEDEPEGQELGDRIAPMQPARARDEIAGGAADAGELGGDRGAGAAVTLDTPTALFTLPATDIGSQADPADRTAPLSIDLVEVFA